LHELHDVIYSITPKNFVILTVFI